MLCFIWLDILTTEEESVTIGIEFVCYQFWRNTITNRSWTVKSILFPHQSSMLFHNTAIKNPTLIISTSFPTLKILKSLVCMKMPILLIKTKSPLKLWRLFFQSNLECRLLQVANLQIRSWWKWQLNSLV